MGIGDDAAVIHPKGAREYLLITTDMLLEGIDFRLEWTTPRCLGCKAIAVNMSDLAAMGARPLYFTVSLALPAEISERWIADFYDGLTDPAHSMGAQLIGGDLSLSEEEVSIAITAVGESRRQRVLYREGGRAGDVLYVTGVLGRSAAGLRLLQTGHRNSRSRLRQEAIHAHQSPEPRCDAGLWLAQCGSVRCMMDLSDGLSMDLPRLCAASGVGAEIDAEKLPVYSGSRRWKLDPAELALHGGEDYELLFAVPEAKSYRFEDAYPPHLPGVTRIGRLTGDPGKIWMIDREGRRWPLLERGYDHFRRRPEQKQ
jgi:thiamine-monophosphate kinase